MSIYYYVYIDQIHNLWKFGEAMFYQTQMPLFLLGFPLFLQLPEQKVPYSNGPYISTFQTILSVCLSVILEFCLLLSFVCGPLSVFFGLLSTAYTNLCRGLQYLLKVRYIILNYSNVAQFLIFETFSLGRVKTLTYVWK